MLSMPSTVRIGVVAVLMASALWHGRAAGQVTLGFEQVAVGLASPVGIAHAGDGSGRLFIVQQTGQILILEGGAIRPTPFLNIASLVSCCGERGLLGLAFHPNFKQNKLFYVNYTNVAGDTIVARYQVSGDPNVADPASAQQVLTVPQPFANHNGGQLAFGPDRFLYIGMGDGGSGGDPGNRAQNLGDLLGKMLRLDVDGGVPYAIPASNPFRNRPDVRPEIWAFGLRNPWRFSFDRLTGDLFIADVGQNSREEVNFQSASSPGGENYGWRLMEGTQCFNPSSGCNDGTLTLPILEYTHALGCSITGGFRSRGTRFPQLAGRYFYGDLCTGRIFGATFDGSQWSAVEMLDTTFTITTFGEDEAGELYLAHYGQGNNGTIQRLVELNQSFLLSVNRGGQGTGTVVSSPAGIQCGSACSGPYGGGVTVTLTATPSAGSLFVGWSGGGCSGTGSCVVTVTSATAVTATFDRQIFTLSTGIVGSGSGGVASTPAGIMCPSTCAAGYPSGTAVALTASPAAGSSFTGWSGGGCTGTGQCNVTLSGNTAVTAIFSAVVGLSVSVAGPGTVTSRPAGIACPSTCTSTFAVGSTVTLTAVAGAAATFSGWSGACAGTTGLCSLAMTSSKSVGAAFATSIGNVFTDDPLVPRVTAVKAVHVTELRLAIDQERMRRALPRFPWTDPMLIPGVTPVSAVHVLEMRAALNSAFQAAGRQSPSYSDPAISPRSIPVRAVHIGELRAAVRALQ
jgi:glucose/arabinose dehydrogenase